MNGVWATKHRPNSLTGIVGQDALVAELMAIVADNAPMQHYLFYSPEAGTGKTSVAHALAKDLGYQLIVFNASSKKQRGIEFVEEHIIPLVQSGIRERIFLLDEADQLTEAAQSALKGVIESASGYFILTCNRLPKVSRWLQSRCQVRTFEPISGTHMVDKLIEIASKEGGIDKITGEMYSTIVRKHRGDLRNAIGALQTACNLPLKERQSFIDSLTTPEMDYNRFLKLCFRDKAYEEGVKMLIGPVREQIRNVFTFAVNGVASPANKMRVVEAAIVSERDIINGVDEQVVRHNFVRMMCQGGQ